MMAETSVEILEGSLPDGRRIRRFAMANETLSLGILDFGAALHGLTAFDHPDPLTLGSLDAAAYAGIFQNFGTVVGPVANRIAGAEAQIDGRTLRFDANQDGRHTLHSGSAGINTKTWTLARHDSDHVEMTIDLPEGEGGLPGNRRITSRYRLDGAILIHELEAETDAPTFMNPALHGYWSMQPPEMTWAGQRLTIHADTYLPVDDDILPTGEIRSVEGTDFDFRKPRALDPRNLPDFDHNFCLATAPRGLSPALRLESDATGLAMTVHTTAPGLQVFGMHPFSVEGERTVHGVPYPHRAGFAIEPQMWPDAPGRDSWPGIVLRPGDTFRQASHYSFKRLKGN